MTDFYILGGKDEHEVVESDLMSWAQWFADDRHRIVAQDHAGPFFISTVFVGFDMGHAWMRKDGGPPIVYETMIFEGDEGSIYCDRCATWDEALAMHARALALATTKIEGGS